MPAADTEYVTLQGGEEDGEVEKGKPLLPGEIGACFVPLYAAQVRILVYACLLIPIYSSYQYSQYFWHLLAVFI